MSSTSISSYSQGFYNDTYEYIALAYSITAVVVGILLGLLGKFHIMFNLIDALAIVYFLFFVKANPPTNVIDFQKMFGKFHYDRMYDYLKSSVSNTYQYYTSIMFQAYGLDSFFLNNTTLSFCIIIGMVGVYVILKIASFIPMGRLQTYLKDSLKRAWEFDYFIYILWIFYNQFSVFCFLQKDAMYFDSTLQKVNFAIFALVALILVAFPLLFGYLISKNQEEIALPSSMRSFQIRYLSLVSGYKISASEDKNYQNANAQNYSLTKDQNPQDKKEQALSVQTNIEIQQEGLILNTQKQMDSTPFGKYVNIFILFRKIIFAGALVVLQDHRIITLSVFSGANILLFFLYIIARPHILLIDNIRNAATEALFIAMQVLIYFFNDITSSTTSYNTSQPEIGWAYVSIGVFILAIHLLDVLAKLFIEIYWLIKGRSSKVAPLPIAQENDLQHQQHLKEEEKKSLNEIQQQNEKQQAVIPLQQQPQQMQGDQPLQQQNIPQQSLNNQMAQNQNYPVSLQHIQANNLEENKPEITQIDRKMEEVPMKTAKTSFNDFLISDNMLPNLANAEERQKYKQRVKPLLFKRNPFIPKNGYYDNIIHDGDLKVNNSNKNVGFNANPVQRNTQNMMERATDVDFQNF
ncbi:transmembrane protein, putative (macronuclear) [Tetrahymena thermophila SB210]|uniref:Transmembrane protein, putative n=1 Tax=Tetrahymena thermophila (strain SB210) TaxID=312017 RepID=Q237H0_TETTS|nr:transmembrane protein, putative [Tetrahymena thermophila SB210]EAR92771.2 transmembrane protein, putative [Tetrahymena thermophila SB210]|eukprot:XP_001013016.2 transmembrane protein, putative [Tetrahymena thermophila SB210]